MLFKINTEDFFFSLNKIGHLFFEFGMLPQSLNIPMQSFAELCRSSQVACAEIGDIDIHEKIMSVISTLCVHENWHQQFVKNSSGLSD